MGTPRFDEELFDAQDKSKPDTKRKLKSMLDATHTEAREQLDNL
jgi:hypothetical protein